MLEPLELELVRAGSGRGGAAAALLVGADFAVIVLDVQMPGMDGFETARLIKARTKTRHVPIIFLTAISGEPEHHLQGYGSGAVDYVYKPFEPEILRAKVAVFLELWRRGVTIGQTAGARPPGWTTRRRPRRPGPHTSELERSNTELERLAEAGHQRGPGAAPHRRRPPRPARRPPRPTASPPKRPAVEPGIAVTDRVRDVLLRALRRGPGLGRRIGHDPVPLADIVAEAETELRPVLEKTGATVAMADLPTFDGDRRMLDQSMTASPNTCSPTLRRGARSSIGSKTGTAVGSGMARVDVTAVGPVGQPGPPGTVVHGLGRRMGLALSRRSSNGTRGRIWGEAGLSGTGVHLFRSARPGQCRSGP